MKKLSVIIVNFNTKDFLIECLKNLTDKYENKEIIVVDNASTDGSAQAVATFSGVKYIQNNENVGLAKASNIGLASASGDYILYLGTDALPKNGTIEGMISYMEVHTDVGLATCKLVLADGSLDMDAHRGFPTPWASITYFSKSYKLLPKSKLLNSYFMGYADMNVPHEIDLCISHFMLIRKEVFANVGKWDEDFFLFGEDVDFCYRIKAAGWKIMYLPQFEAMHHKGATIGIRKTTASVSKASAETKERVKKERARARDIFYKKHFESKYPKLLNTIVKIGNLIFTKLKR